MISCNQLTIARPGGDLFLFDRVSFEVADGRWAEFVGPSGSGKSVLYSLAALEVRPDRGRFVVNGRNVERLDAEELAGLRRRIGSCRQPPEFLADRSVLENLIVPLVVRGEADDARSRGERLLKEAELGTRMEVPVRRLAAGERWLLGVLRAAVGSPDLVLIDGAIDVLADRFRTAAEESLNRVHERGSTVLLFGREMTGLDRTDTLTFEIRNGAIERMES